MLTELSIKDFAIIDDLDLEFSGGFNVMTGETGAGKSIILDAVGLLMGERADTTMVRAGAKLAIIEGVFTLPEGEIHEAVTAVVEREELEGDSDVFVIVSREVKRSGRSTARVNGRTVTLDILREIGEAMVDIHGQGAHLSLLRPDAHLIMLDRYAGLEGQRAAFTALVKQIQKVRKELKRLIRDEEQMKQRAEMLAHQVEEITAADLEPGELSDLQEEAKRLANAEQIAALASDAYQAIEGSSDEVLSAADRLTEAAAALAKLIKFDLEAKPMAEMAEEISVKVDELARDLADYEEEIEFNPVRLQQVELRIDLIKTLMRRYNTDDIAGLLEGAEDAKAELTTLQNSDKQIEALSAEEAALLTQIGTEGEALSLARKQAAETLSDAVESELDELRMSKAQFKAAIEHKDDPNGVLVGDYRVAFDETGVDKVEFLLSPNVGEPLKPMAKIASGGETSRIMLALKTVLSRADDTPTLIFDEIDTGIGGRIGAVVGRKLWSLSDGHQVLVVTHLPQLAGFADSHFKVEKQYDGDRTTTHVYQLEPEHRVEELAQMLGPEAGSSRQSAQEIIDYVTEIKRQGVPTS